MTETKPINETVKGRWLIRIAGAIVGFYIAQYLF